MADQVRAAAVRKRPAFLLKLFISCLVPRIRLSLQPQITEVLPKSGLVFSEKGVLTEVLFA